MILYCGVTKEEIFEPGICVDMMIDGGTADEPLNIYEVGTWKQLLEKYKDVDYIFIDGWIYGSFKDLKNSLRMTSLSKLIPEYAINVVG